jgi:hypothetical protein
VNITLRYTTQFCDAGCVSKQHFPELFGPRSNTAGVDAQGKEEVPVCARDSRNSYITLQKLFARRVHDEVLQRIIFPQVLGHQKHRYAAFLHRYAQQSGNSEPDERSLIYTLAIDAIGIACQLYSDTDFLGVDSVLLGDALRVHLQGARGAGARLQALRKAYVLRV